MILVEERIDRVTRPGCWLWTGAVDAGGYGIVSILGRANQRVHRVMYQLFYGAIPFDLEILHSCHVTNCCNPDHLTADLHAKNMDQVGERRREATAPSCQRGHEWPKNLVVRVRSNGKSQRICRPCQRLSELRYQTKKAARV